MKNGLGKTILIVVGIVLSIAIIFCGVFALFIPKQTARFCSYVGWYKLATHFNEKEYSARPTTENLENLVKSCITSDYKDGVSNYGQKLLNDENYKKTYSNPFYATLTSTLVKIQYYKNDATLLDKAFSWAIIKEGSVNYIEPTNNCLHYFILVCVDSSDVITLSGIKIGLTEAKEDYSEQDVLAELDILIGLADQGLKVITK